mmetsp:Transcript_82796/g.230894  ORF Transcript_82796/g.230894 Transcript_82796/m.230894 type:complete len:253 (+) Transcript_82796:30-788(+)
MCVRFCLRRRALQRWARGAPRSALAPSLDLARLLHGGAAAAAEPRAEILGDRLQAACVDRIAPAQLLPERHLHHQAKAAGHEAQERVHRRETHEQTECRAGHQQRDAWPIPHEGSLVVGFVHRVRPSGHKAEAAQEEEAPILEASEQAVREAALRVVRVHGRALRERSLQADPIVENSGKQHEEEVDEDVGTHHPKAFPAMNCLRFCERCRRTLFHNWRRSLGSRRAAGRCCCGGRRLRRRFFLRRRLRDRC